MLAAFACFALALLRLPTPCALLLPAQPLWFQRQLLGNSQVTRPRERKTLS
jgi:hypothetical protein